MISSIMYRGAPAVRAALVCRVRRSTASGLSHHCRRSWLSSCASSSSSTIAASADANVESPVKASSTEPLLMEATTATTPSSVAAAAAAVSSSPAPIHIAFEYDWGEAVMRAFKMMMFGIGLAPIAYYMYSDMYSAEIASARLWDPIAAAASSSARKPVVGRDVERSLLKGLFSATPDRIALITGPTDCGTSTLLLDVLKDRHNAIYMSLRQYSIASVNEFVRAFNNVASIKFLELRSWLVDIMPFAGGENFQMRDTLSHNEFQKALECLTKALEIASKTSDDAHRPVIVIDDFDLLMKLTNEKEGHRLVQSLLAWCIHVTKERSLAHIVLGISDGTVLKNMRFFGSNAVANRIRFISIGDLVREDIEEYMVTKAKDYQLNISKEDIQQIYSVCGGRVMDADAILNDMKAGFKLSSALHRLINSHRQRISQALFSEADDDDDDASDETAAGRRCWNAIQLWKAMKMLVDSENGYVAYTKMRQDVFEGDDAALQELIEMDVIGVRVSSSSDMKAIAAKDDTIMYVTAEAPASMAAYRSLLGDASIQEHIAKIKQQQRAEAELDEVVTSIARLNERLRATNKAKRELLASFEIAHRLKELLAPDVYKDRLEKLVQRDRRITEREAKLDEKLQQLVHTKECLQMQQ